MVRKLLVLMLLVWGASADDRLYDKIKSLIGEQTYAENQAFISIIFSPEESYFANDRLDVVQVVETLKENGLMNLFFEKPQQLELTFSTNGSPLFFVKLMGETLRAMGYYRYITEESRLDNSAFIWKIRLTTEYATDPSSLRDELLKRSCDIIDIERESAEKWAYNIDMSQAHLNLQPLQSGREVTIRRSLDAHWLNVSEVSRLTLSSLRGNNWYPYIAFYDSSLRLLKVYKRDRKTWEVTVRPPRDAVYVKVADLYTLKNIKDGFRIIPKGVK
ncbi:MAG: hypothetical protein R3302_01745 [Sulfurimonadaceae bacterium]|nr:hypothetical protein [Sulfurimonadaceae bacterium]